MQDTKTRDTGLGIHIADLPTDKLPPGAQVLFTFFWPDADRWEGVDFAVTIAEGTDSVGITAGASTSTRRSFLAGTLPHLWLNLQIANDDPVFST